MGNSFCRIRAVCNPKRPAHLYSPDGELRGLTVATREGRETDGGGCVLYRWFGDARSILGNFARDAFKDHLPKDDSPFFPLTESDEIEVEEALYGGDGRNISLLHEPSQIEITAKELSCLRRGGWLNDEVINLYLQLLKEREQREPKRFLKCHFFNTFFYKKLTDPLGYDYNAVKRWTSYKKLGYALHDCHKIFVPVHKGNHWCLAIINVKDECFNYLDSFGGIDKHVIDVLAKYFMDELRDKHNMEIDTSSWPLKEVHDLPLQKNGSDCGMFMLKYIDFYSRGLKLSFSQGDMEYFRRRTAKEILRLRAD